VEKHTGVDNEGASQDEAQQFQQEKENVQQEIASLKDKIKQQESEVGQEDQESGDAVEALQAQVAELNDKLLRVAAESENVKRRAALDVQKSRDFAIESFAKDIVNVLDHLYRAEAAFTDELVAQNTGLQAVKEGVEMTRKEMQQVFDRHHLKRVSPEGAPFDHNYHQAMAQVEDATVDANTVIQVIQAGYTLKDRLLRPALVNVSKKPAS
jgi:molecular chaperone GrpE